MLGAVGVRPRAIGACGVLAALALAGCGTTGSTGVNISGKTLTIYASQPPGTTGGQAAADVIDAEQLAFKQSGAKAGSFTLAFKVLHSGEISAHARAAIQDQSAIAYLGEIEPGTSQISVEITNQLDLLEVSPTDTAVYLTQSTPAVSGAPSKYYPSSSSYHQTFARVVPTTIQEAQAIVSKMQALHVSSVYIESDGSPYGASIAAEVRSAAPSHGLTVASSAAGAGAVFYGGNSASAAATAIKQAAAAGSAKLFVPSALYDSSFVANLGPTVAARLYVSTPGFAPGSLPASASSFESAFKFTYGHAPAPEAIFGYEAMSAVLAVLREAGSAANQRATVVKDFLAIKDRQSVLGTYSLHNGDTSLAPFTFAQVRGGQLVPGS
ncbi:MAG: type 1 periplasmic-binding domain-containing protein [Solirubrobacteraceae bacterium]